ncbi:MAG: response regulator transcription factor [Devosia sp.]|nr:response regulator transcription factor [Devosia sp.]
MRLLILEDNEQLAAWLAKLLRADNYVVDWVADGESVLGGVDLANYDLLLVDLTLPGIGGIEVVRGVRARGVSTPILILTARNELQSRVEGLNAGADDYLTKPFEIEELEARLRALLRRSSAPLKTNLQYGPLSMDLTSRTFALNGQALHLSPREHAILETLLRRSGGVVRKEALLEAAYGFDDEVNLAAIEVQVHRLRKKLEGSTISIATLRGLGYLLRQQAN